ncbi:hypothetical protein OSCI_3790025 [Kamptonema sp. PCC 6506]|nr:hypothetical protein OSCI_3790025 [Kamptonema sp. PCC 6506]
MVGCVNPRYQNFARLRSQYSNLPDLPDLPHPHSSPNPT